MAPVVFAALASVSMGLWVVFNKVAAGYVNQLLGAILLSVTAVVIGGTVFLLRGPPAARLVTSPKGIIFVALAGAAAFSMDFLGLTAYSQGLPITIGGPIIIGGSIAVSTLLGFSLGEPATITKVIAIVLIVVGAALLARMAEEVLYRITPLVSSALRPMGRLHREEGLPRGRWEPCEAPSSCVSSSARRRDCCVGGAPEREVLRSSVQEAGVWPAFTQLVGDAIAIPSQPIGGIDPRRPGASRGRYIGPGAALDRLAGPSRRTCLPRWHFCW